MIIYIGKLLMLFFCSVMVGMYLLEGVIGESYVELGGYLLCCVLLICDLIIADH